MANKDNELVDTQLVAENVGFLDYSFDNSFTLQTSLKVLKKYIAEEEQHEISISKDNGLIPLKNKNTSLINRTLMLESSLNENYKIKTECTKLFEISNKRLKDWGLPFEIAEKYEQRGIIEMFDWQVACLSNSKILLDYCNLVYSAPTSAGKTLVAEILTIKTVLERQKKVIIILPFVSIVREKMFYLQDILSSSGIRVEGFIGSQTPPGGLQAVHVAICTIEKANSLINRLLDDGAISDLGAVVVDELHLLGDSHRGYILELLLTKIKYVTLKVADVQIQIVGMSATLPNLEVLANWLSAELFVTQFRPIPLDEYCLVGNKFYDKHGNHVNSMENAKSIIVEGDSVLNICLDTIKDGCSVLIFCMTKNRCEHLSQSIASSFYNLGCSKDTIGPVLREQLKSESIMEVLEQLKNCPVGLDQVLKNTISFGVAYHHAGLTFDERDIIEGGFKSGAIRVLVATSTLSSGVNLPARKVIIRSPVFQRQPINILSYKQMVGRAGRMGKDIKGESILICTEAEKKIGFDLMMGALDPVKSCIESEDKFMRAVLEMIASQVACSKSDLELYAKCTLLFTQQNILSSENSLLETTLEKLKDFELIRIQDIDAEKHYLATPLGKACLSSSMAPNDGLSLFCELQRARECLVLETDLHLIYLVTPYSVSGQWGNIDWLHLFTLWERLTKSMKRVGELVGIQESFIIRCLRGTNKLSNIQEKLNIHKRFYTALALQDLVNEVPLSEVATKFQCARGFLQSLQQAASTFAGMVTAFCRQLGWKNMDMLISQFQDRLHFGIHSELLELMKLSSLNGPRARALFDAGFETISHIASADVNIIENTLHKSVPFQSDKEREGDDSADIRKRNKIKNIWITGCCGLTIKEAAENLIREARKYLEHEIGVAEIKWNCKMPNNTITKQNVSIKKNKSITDFAVVSPLNGTVPVTEQPITKSNKNINDDMQVESNKPQLLNGSNESVKGTFCDLAKDPTINNETEVLSKENDVLLDNPNNINNSATFKYISSVLQDVTNKCDHPLDVKDEIIWDSLNLTENALENITKQRTSDKLFSPNISFGEVEKNKSFSSDDVTDHNIHSKTLSVKDVSLFSTDGDNSSLFDDSLPLDLIPNKLLDKPQASNLCKNEISSNYNNINTKSILNVFKSTIIYTDEGVNQNRNDDNTLQNGSKTDCFNVSDSIESTQNIGEICVNSMFKSPLKRNAEVDKSKKCSQTLAKKPRPNTNSDLKHNLTSDGSLKNSFNTKCSDSKRFTITIYKYKLNCYVLRRNDVVDNLYLMKNIKEASLYLGTENHITNCNKLIGSNIFMKSDLIDNNVMKETYNKTRVLKAIAICINQETCIILDLTSLDEFFNFVKGKLTEWLQQQTLKLKMMSFKFNYVHFKKCFGIDIPTTCVDISLAEWLIDSDEKTPTIEYLTARYCDMDLSTLLMTINTERKMLKDLDTFEDMCAKAWLVWMIAEKQQEYLAQEYTSFYNTTNIEIHVTKILADCELCGLTVDKDLASKLLIDVKSSQEILQKKAYKICGYHFNFNSSKDVAKVLGIYRGRKVSTKKTVLTSHNSPLSSIVIYWRKLNSILTKTLYPLTEKACIYSDDKRVKPAYTTYTCTGRISMHEPNLQNVPRTFSIPVKYLTVENMKSSCEDVIEFNCRNIFKAARDCVLVSADYCQLEMRILSHYSDDIVLNKIMCSDMDVFKSIAASWGGVPEEEVDDDLRQKAKQLCYGILYGMGNKSLSQQLDVTEIEAAIFMDSFHKAYPGIRRFTESVIGECKKRGYVETLMKRRRYLPDINSNIISKKNAAERQAVNTTVQGSAADIAKAAMCAIDSRTTSDPHRPRLILQLHDELIYEVPESNKNSFIMTIKEIMENTVMLKVPLPVKVKVGYSWGSLHEVQI